MHLFGADRLGQRLLHDDLRRVQRKLLALRLRVQREVKRGWYERAEELHIAVCRWQRKVGARTEVGRSRRRSSISISDRAQNGASRCRLFPLNVQDTLARTQ